MDEEEVKRGEKYIESKINGMNNKIPEGWVKGKSVEVYRDGAIILVTQEKMHITPLTNNATGFLVFPNFSALGLWLEWWFRI